MTDNASLSVWRDVAVALCEYAIDYDRGRSKDDPVYLEVVEGRDVGAARARYSSCGDLPHWLYWRLGVREPWVNRQPGWRVGKNITLLVGGLIGVRDCAPAVPPGGLSWVPESGDVLWLATPADHVCVVLERPAVVPFFGPRTAGLTEAWQRAHGLKPDCVVGPRTWASAGVVGIATIQRGSVGAEVARWQAIVGVAESEIGALKTANYGAGGMSSTSWPGARAGLAQLSCASGRWTYGVREVRGVVPLSAIVPLITAAPNCRGASLTGEVLDAVGAEP